MCGITGVALLYPDIATRSISRVCSLMLDQMPWRGPDAKGVWSNDQIGLGHVRLSIIDLSADANQPLIDGLGNVIVFNGEIYNYRELKKELSYEYEFKTKSDTEVILAAYAKWGENCVKRFNGEWAFAIFDTAKQILFLSRDRFGIKPLYFTIKNNILYFASEIRALLAVAIPARISLDKIAEFLKFRQIEQRYQTILEDIYPLEPGKNLFVDCSNGQIQEQYYYEASDILSSHIPHDENEAMEMFGGLLQDAVKLRLHADVPVQILLSGGLDSSAISALSVKSTDNAVNTLSCIFPGNANDESYYSDMVADFLGTGHHRVKINSNHFFQIFDEVILAQDFPTYSEKHVARYLLYQKASHNAKVILEGQGGDEVFGGYGRMYQIFREHYQNDLGVNLLMLAPKKEKKSSLPHFAELHPEIRNNIGRVKKNIETYDIVDVYAKRQFSILRSNLLSLLHTGDRLQMYNSIEGRYPFLDHRIVEMGISMPVRFKMMTHDKWLLRKYLDINSLLPKEVIYRTDKKGFSTDLDDFLRKSLDARSHLQHSFADGVSIFPGLFDKNALEQLLVEQYEHGLNNTRRLLAVYSLMKYLSNNKVSITN